MTAPTPFEKRLIELNLTYAQIELVKQAVEELVIGDDEERLPRFLTRAFGTEKQFDRSLAHRNELRGEQRTKVRG